MTAERPRPALRALRGEPLLLDDRAVDARLAAVVRRPAEARTALTPELARWARAWLVCWHAALVADDRYGRDDPWRIALPLDAIRTPAGGGDATRRARVLDALVAAGVVTVEGAEGSGAVTVRVAREMFTEHRAAVAVDWAGAIAAAGAEPAALLVLRALTDLIVPLDGWASVPRRDLVARTGYRQKQVRVALRRLATAGLLDLDGDAGRTSRYRFTPRIFGRAWEPVPTEDGHTPIPAVGAPQADGGTPPAAQPAPPIAPSVGASGGVCIEIAGVTLTLAPGISFALGAGFSATLEVGRDGRPRLVVVQSSGLVRQG